MKYQNLVIDISNLFWRSIYNSLEKYIKKENHEIYIYSIHEALTRLTKLIDKYGYKDSKVFCLLDNPNSKTNIRKILTKGSYKHSRENNKLEFFYPTLNVFIEILKIYSENFYILQVDGVEADDITKPLKEYIKPDNFNLCLFISADLDWARNIDKYSHWYNYIDFYTKEKFYQKYNFNPVGESVQLCKALKGDKIDCIENAIPYLPQKILMNILSTFKNVDDFYTNLFFTDYPDKWKKRLKEAEGKVRMNYKLVDFLPIEDPIETYIFKCKKNIKLLELYFKWLNIPYKGKMIPLKDKKNEFFTKKKAEFI